MFLFLLIACPGITPSGKDSASTDSPPIDTGVPDTDTDTASAESQTGDPETGDTDTGGPHFDTSPREECEVLRDTDPEYLPSVGCDPALAWMDVVGGFNATCGIKSDGCAQCWGEEMGLSKFAVPGETFAKIAMSSMTYDADAPHVCGLTTDGRVLCWGGPDDGGENDTPVGTFFDVATGSSGGWALPAEGGIVEWDALSNCLDGDYSQVVASAGDYGALRQDGTLEVSSAIGTPLVVDGTWAAIGHGWQWVCGVRTDLGGKARCVSAYDGMETTIPFGGTNPEGIYTQVCASASLEACALDAAGTPTCWSYNSTPVLIPPPSGPFTKITCGAGHACGLTPEGEIECWGDDYSGETTPPS